MKPNPSVCAFLVPFLALACRASAPAASAAPAAAAPSRGEVAGGKASGGDAPAAKYGVLAPIGAVEIALWPEAYSGGWLVLEVEPHGAPVAEGDVIARLDARDIDETLHQAELTLATSRLEHRATVERNQLAAEAARGALERARAGLERARRGLTSWKEDELAFSRRQDELSRRYQEANVEDQNDELDQLEKMYEGDELVDATEVIVLKRSRRGLALTQEQNALSRDRAKVRMELELALDTERREEEVRAQAEALSRLEHEQAIEARARADAELRSADALALQEEKLARLKRDRALFELRAPAAGLLLHGALRDYRPGKTPARLERGSSLATRSPVFVVAPPEPLGVAFDVTDAERARFGEGAKLTVRTLAGAAKASVSLELDRHPRTLGVGETSLEALARLEDPLSGTCYGERVRVDAGSDEK